MRAQDIADKYGIFQFTTSQGGRLDLVCCREIRETFQFTTSQGGRRQLSATAFVHVGLSIHDLTRRSTVIRNPE